MPTDASDRYVPEVTGTAAEVPADLAAVIREHWTPEQITDLVRLLTEEDQ